MKRGARYILTVVGIVLVAVVVGIAGERGLPVVRVAENWSRDLRVATLTPGVPQSDAIVVVTVTEETLAAFPYRSPIDRRFVAELLRTLRGKGARLIGLDLLLDQPTEPDKDEELRRALRSPPLPVVVATADTSDGLTAEQHAFLVAYLDGVPQGVPMIGPDPVDGVVRALPLGRTGNGSVQPAFVTAIAQALGIDVPEADALPLRFRGAPDDRTPPFAVYPAHAAALLPDAWFDERVVLVGVDLPLQDRHRTPFSVTGDSGTRDMPGVLLQAHALSQLIEAEPAPSRSSLQGVLVTLAFAAIGAGIVVLGLPAAAKALGLLMATAILWVGGFALYASSAALVPLVPATLALLLSALLTFAWRWREERVQRRFIHDAFAKYVAPSIVDHLVANPDELRLGGERRVLSFVFTDIAGYTSLTETTEPTFFVELMNRYLEGTTEIVLSHGGTLEKYVGDALHVMFNAPVEQPDHAERAVACALELDAWCQEFASGWRARGIEFGITRIGVNTGTVLVGNFGGRERFDYSATGDAINTAARLESVNKQLGTRVCISGETASRCPGVAFRPVGELVLKGKSEAVAAFEPCPKGGNTHCGIEEYMAAYRMLSGAESGARAAFRRLAEQWPHDPLVAFHLGRLEAGESGSRVVLKEK